MSGRGWAVKPMASLCLALALLLGAPVALSMSRAQSGVGTGSQTERGPDPAEISDCGPEVPVGLDSAVYARVVRPGAELAIHVLDPERGRVACRLPYGSVATSPDGATLYLGHNVERAGRLVAEVLAVDRAGGSIRRVYAVSTASPPNPAPAGLPPDRAPNPVVAPSLDGRLLYVLVVDRTDESDGTAAETTWRSELVVLDLATGEITDSVPVAAPFQAIGYWAGLVLAPDGMTLSAIERVYEPIGEDVDLAEVRVSTVRTDPPKVVGAASVSLATAADDETDPIYADCGQGYESDLAATADGSAFYGFCRGGTDGVTMRTVPPILRFFDPRTLRETGQVDLATADADADSIAVASPDNRLLYVVDVSEETHAIRVVDLASGAIVRSADLAAPAGAGAGRRDEAIAWLGQLLAPEAAAKGRWPNLLLSPDGRRLFLAAGEIGIWEIDLGDLRVTRVFEVGNQYLDLALAPTGDRLIALEGSYRVAYVDLAEGEARSVDNGLAAEPLFNEVLFP